MKFKKEPISAVPKDYVDGTCIKGGFLGFHLKYYCDENSILKYTYLDPNCTRFS